jgi:LacI family transcriptional regulator
MAISNLRLQGYKTALQKNKISFDAELVKEVDFTERSTFTAMQQFMKMKMPPTAIFAVINYVSLDAIKYLKKNFPAKVNKIDFVGFGNLPLLQYLDQKPIASVEENSYQIGFEAAKLLLKNINLPETEIKKMAEHIKLPCKLVIHK